LQYKISKLAPIIVDSKYRLKISDNKINKNTVMLVMLLKDLKETMKLFVKYINIIKHIIANIGRPNLYKTDLTF